MPTLKAMVEKYKITPDKNGAMKGMTGVFRSSYAFVYRPYDNGKDEPKFSIQMIFLKTDDKALKPLVQLAANCAAKKWGEIKNWPKMRNNLFKLAEDEEELSEEHYKGTIIISARSSSAPGIVGPNAKPMVDGEEFYSGCFARATVACYAYDRSENKGVSFGLNNLMMVRDGDRLDGRSSAENDFGEYAVEDEGTDGDTEGADGF